MKRGGDSNGATGMYALIGLAVIAYVAAFMWIASLGVSP